jgi:hypothetical protein
MKKVIRLNENDLKKVVNRIIEQQDKFDINQTAKKRFDELNDKVSKGFCVPVFEQGSLIQLRCKDGHYWVMNEYRQAGKD